MAANPLLCWRSSTFPAFDQIQAKHVVPAYNELIKQLEGELEALEQRAGTRGWDSLVHGLENVTDQLNTNWNIVSLLRDVKGSPEFRAAAQQVEGGWVSFERKLKQSRPIFEAFKAIRDSTAFATLDPSRKRIVEAQIKQAELNGASLKEEAKARFNEIEQELELLAAKLPQEQHSQKLVTDVSQLEGLPIDVIHAAAQAAVSKGYKGATLESGPWIFTFPVHASVWSHAKNRALREDIYMEYMTNAVIRELDNTPIINRILQLRKEKARLLGYENYAEVAMLQNMATPRTAQDMLEKLRSACEEGAAKELEELKSLEGAPEEIMPWDVHYLQRLRASSNETKTEVEVTFPLPNVLEGLFALTKELFSVKAEAADDLAPVWHEDVMFFTLRDAATGKLLGYFYLDPYSRPSEKRPGAWTTDIVVKSRLLAPEGSGSVRLPIVAMICGMERPAGPGVPALVSLIEIRPLFREFGNALQHMLTIRDDGLIGGSQEFDAVELASKFMENWCYQRAVISTFGYHYMARAGTGTRAPLPDAVYEHLMTARRQLPRMEVELGRALIDLELHTSFQVDGVETIHDVSRRHLLRSTVLSAAPRYFRSFLDIFTTRYTARFYGHKWSEMLSDDAFGAFEEVGLANKIEMKMIGKRFRDTVLSLAGAKPALEVFKEFRGRAPAIDAMARKYGLKIHEACLNKPGSIAKVRWWTVELEESLTLEFSH